MGDHLALLVDRLLTESTLEAAIRSSKLVQIRHPPPSATIRGCEERQITIECSAGWNLVECRICQEEDVEINLEAPCACRGSLKFAHRKCVQHWCNEKGDTSCEICLQPFRPDYTAPQQLFHYGSTPMNFRGNWGISRQDSDDQIMVPSAHDLISNYNNGSSRSTICCRTVAVIFMALLILRHALPLLLGGSDQYSFTLFSFLMLRTAGVLFPIMAVARAIVIFHRRRSQQDGID